MLKVTSLALSFLAVMAIAPSSLTMTAYSQDLVPTNPAPEPGSPNPQVAQASTYRLISSAAYKYAHFCYYSGNQEACSLLDRLVKASIEYCDKGDSEACAGARTAINIKSQYESVIRGISEPVR
jgi:hypothetical protein